MSKDEEMELIPETEESKKNVMQSAKDFMNGVLHPLKGKDLGQLVEDFTSEMTLVAEGLSEDQQKLFRETDKLSAQQTELEQRLLDYELVEEGFGTGDTAVDEGTGYSDRDIEMDPYRSGGSRKGSGRRGHDGGSKAAKGEGPGNKAARKAKVKEAIKASKKKSGRNKR